LRRGQFYQPAESWTSPAGAERPTQALNGEHVPLMTAWMHEQRVLATTSIGSAIRYTLKNWDRLTVFVRDPLVWLDNNRTERGLRGPSAGVISGPSPRGGRSSLRRCTAWSNPPKSPGAILSPTSSRSRRARSASRAPPYCPSADFKAAL
jgi:hypothetical protein